MVMLRTTLAVAFIGTLFLLGCADQPPNAAKTDKGTEPVATAQPVKAEEGAKTEQPGKTAEPAELAAQAETEKGKVVPAEPAKTGDSEKPVKDEPPIPLDKWKATVLEEKWGLKLKAVTYQPPPNGIYTFVIEFGKDLTEKELTAFERTIDPPFVPQQTLAPGSVSLCFFDQDNVLVERRKVLTMSNAFTEMTGTKGDAFRLKIGGPSKSGIVRAELRLVRESRDNKDKDKDKDAKDKGRFDKDKGR